MDVNFTIEDATANPIKFTLDGAPVDQRAAFDQRRYRQTTNTTVDPEKVYKQLFEKTDAIRIQFYSNFPANRVSIVDCDDNVYGPLMFPSVAVEYRNKYFRSGCKFSSINDKMFIYFDQNLSYLDEEFTVAGELVAYNGRLPNINAVAGDIIRYSFDGTTFLDGAITEIRWSPDLQAEGYLTDVDITLVVPIDGFVEILYDEKPANLWTQLISLAALDPGTYFIRREHGLGSYDVSFTSEPIQVDEYYGDTLAIEYRHVGTYNRDDLWNYVYLFDWSNTIRIPAAFYKFTPAGEIELDVNDYGVPRVLRAVPYRQLEISFYNMPSWLADKLQMALAHDVKIINGYEWEVENFGQFELVDRLDLGTYTVVLRQKDDRTKKTDEFTYTITAEFVPPTHVDIPSAGGDYVSEFITNTAGTFHFITVPSWITPDHATFVNGDEISFAIAAVGTIGRTATLTAMSDAIDGLTAEIVFTQLGDTTPPAEFLDVADDNITLIHSAGANWAVLVSSSGDYDISYSGAFTFAAVKELGFAQIRISSPTANPGPTARTGVVRLTLQSNPAIFKDVDVTQSAPPPQLISTLPTLWNSPNRYATRNFMIDTQPGCKWQVYTSDSWIHCSTVLHTGPATINIQLDEADFYDVPREGSATIVNILDPYDTLVIPIEQN